MKRLWGIRHLRWFYHSWRVHAWAIECAALGIGLGIPHESDLQRLARIKRGLE